MIFLVLLINALMGATFSIVRLILDSYTNPLFLVGYRMLLAGSLLLGYLAIFQRSKLTLHRQDCRSFIKVVLFHIYFAYILEVWGLKYLAPAKVALLFNLTPFISATLGFIVHRRKQSLNMLLGLVIGFLGFLPILLEHMPLEDLFGSLGFLSAPELAILAAVGSGAYAWLIVEKLVVKRHYSPFLVNGVGMLVGGALTMLTACLAASLDRFAELVQPWPFTDFRDLTLWVLVLILFSNVIFYNVYAWLMHRYTPTFLAFSGLTIPLFAAGWDWLIFGQVVSSAFWLSLGIVSLGLAIYYRSEQNLVRSSWS